MASGSPSSWLQAGQQLAKQRVEAHLGSSSRLHIVHIQLEEGYFSLRDKRQETSLSGCLSSLDHHADWGDAASGAVQEVQASAGKTGKKAGVLRC